MYRFLTRYILICLKRVSFSIVIWYVYNIHTAATSIFELRCRILYIPRSVCVYVQHIIYKFILGIRVVLGNG